MASTFVKVYKIPKCDFCSKTALYDARLPLVGCWANVCQEHFVKHECSLGTGKGQALIATYDDLTPEAQAEAIKTVRSHIADEEGSCTLSDEEIIRYISDGYKLFYGTGEVYE